MRPRLIWLAAVLIVACSSPQIATGSIEVELADFYIEPAAETIAAGNVVFEVFNEGEFPHTLVVARDSGEVIFASDVVKPGEEIDVDLRLTPDTYQLTCRIVVQLEDGSLVDHYQNGMGETIVVDG